MRAGGMTESAAKLASEMRVIAKAAGMRDLADRLLRMELSASVQKLRRLVQAKRLNKLREGRPPHCEQLLEVAHGDAGLRRHIAGFEVRFGVSTPGDSAKTGEQLVAVPRDDMRIRGREHRRHEVVDHGAHIRIGCRPICFGYASCIPTHLTEKSTGERIAAGRCCRRLETEMGSDAWRGK